MRCPGFSFARIRHISDDEHIRITAYGTARQYHLAAAHPHAFCGCGNDTEDCHPGRCCQDDEWGDCRNCGKPAPEPEPIPESQLTDPLFPTTPTEESR